MAWKQPRWRPLFIAFLISPCAVITPCQVSSEIYGGFFYSGITLIRFHDLLKNAFRAKWFSLQYETTKIWLLVTWWGKFIVWRNNGSPVFFLFLFFFCCCLFVFLLFVFFTLTPCFPLGSRVFHQTPSFPRHVFSTNAHVFHVPCFPHSGTPASRYPPSQSEILKVKRGVGLESLSHVLQISWKALIDNP